MDQLRKASRRIINRIRIGRKIENGLKDCNISTNKMILKSRGITFVFSLSIRILKEKHLVDLGSNLSPLGPKA
jgi:hypothetical protein